MSATAIVVALIIAGSSGFLFGYIFGKDAGQEEGRDQQWLDDFFLTLRTHQKREQSDKKRANRKD